MTTYFFTPPQRQEVNVIEGSLRVSYPVSFTVWKDASGTWVTKETPSTDELATAVEVLAVSGRPQYVDAATAAELISAGIGTVVVT